jgi:hypothetical protein
MATATQTRTGRAATTAEKAQAQADRDALRATLVSKWEAEDLAEKGALVTLADAQRTVDNIRVYKCRIFFNLADLLAYKGEPSLAGATKALHNGKDTKKNTYRPYLAAGKALREAGFNLRTSVPTDEELAIVEKAWNEHKRSVKQAERDAKKAAEAEANGEAGEAEEGAQGEAQGAQADALTFTELLAHVARMNATADLLIKSQVPVGEEDLTLLAKVLDDIQIKLAVYAG